MENVQWTFIALSVDASGVVSQSVEFMIHAKLYALKRAAISFSMALGSVLGECLETGTPSLLTRNFVKFHLMAFMRNPPCLAFKNL